ncbi:MAG: DUF4038 domain-containing protein [Opitutaceae bacterium]|nr:DUF4038 domain-containing protein [Opitutaceae bacterium]
MHSFIKAIAKLTCLAGATYLALTCQLAAAPLAFPLRVADDGRTLVDVKGERVFLHGEAAWFMPKHSVLGEVEDYLSRRSKQGMNLVLLHAVSKEVTSASNRQGEFPFHNHDDILTPNEKYWEYLDAVLEMAERKGYLVGLAPLWLRWGNGDKHGWREQLSAANAQPYAEFLARRYSSRQNILWILGGDSDPGNRFHELNTMAEELARRVPHHLLTLHPNSQQNSSKWFGDSDWLEVDCVYTYEEPQRQASQQWRAYAQAGRHRPMILIEGGYEKESNDLRGGSPHRMRRQYYGSVLNGTLMGHAYGHRDIYPFKRDQWRRAIEDDGSRQMQHAATLFRSVAWWTLEPDVLDSTYLWYMQELREGRFILSGRATVGSNEYASAAVANDGRLAVVYLPTSRAITVDLDRLEVQGALTARWFDPTSGATRAVTDLVPDARSLRVLVPPGRNADGDSDWVLVLEVARHR